MKQAKTSTKKFKFYHYLLIYLGVIILFMGVGMGIFYAAAKGFCYRVEQYDTYIQALQYAGKVGEVACDPDSHMDDEHWGAQVAMRSTLSDYAFTYSKFGILSPKLITVTVFGSESGSDSPLQEGIWDYIYTDNYLKDGIAFVDREKFLESAGYDLYAEWDVIAESAFEDARNQIRVDAYAQKGWECIPMKVTCVDANGQELATKEIYQAADMEDGWEIHEDTSVFLYPMQNEKLTGTAEYRKLYAADRKLAEAIAATVDYTNPDYLFRTSANDYGYYSQTLLSPTSYTHVLYTVDYGRIDTTKAYAMTYVKSYHFGNLAIAWALVTWLSGTILFLLVLGITTIIRSARNRK